jgi:hypothetical protein
LRIGPQLVQLPAMAHYPLPKATHDRWPDCSASFQDTRVADRQLGSKICRKHVDMRWVVIKETS